MKLTPIIATLRARVPRFRNNVAGAAQFKNLPQVGKMVLPAAYVLPADDETGEQDSMTDYTQTLEEGFSVVVALDNTPDERGQNAAFDAVHTLRAELWKALLGWLPPESGGPIYYIGGRVLQLDRNRLYYQYDFAAAYQIDQDDTRLPGDMEAWPEFETLAIDVDFIDPGGPGPDKNIEYQTQFQVNPPTADTPTEE